MRLRELEASEVDDADESARAQMTEDSTLADMRRLETVQGILRMLVAVTADPVASIEAAIALSPDKWLSLDLQSLTQSGPRNFKTVFKNAKDVVALSRIYQKFHMCSDRDIETVLGKAVDGSSD